MERTCVGLLAIPADAAHQLLVDCPILPVHLIELAFFGTLRHGGPADVQRRCRDPATLQALQLRVAGYADLSLRQHHSCKLSATAVNVVLNICFSRSATLVWSGSTSTMFLTHLRDSSSPCERALPNSYLLTSWLCRRFQGLGNYICVLPRILLSESLC